MHEESNRNSDRGAAEGIPFFLFCFHLHFCFFPYVLFYSRIQTISYSFVRNESIYVFFFFFYISSVCLCYKLRGHSPPSRFLWQMFYIIFHLPFFQRSAFRTEYNFIHMGFLCVFLLFSFIFHRQVFHSH